MSEFTQPFSTEAFENAIDTMEGMIEGVNSQWSLLCPHVRSIREDGGEVQDYESVATKKHDKVAKINIDGNLIKLEGKVFRCDECGKRFFVPLSSLHDKRSENRFKSFAETYLGVLRLFKDLTYAEPTVRGMYDGDVNLNVPSTVRGRVGKPFLDELAGRKITNRSGSPRVDRTLQLDRAFLLLQLEALTEVYTAIVDYFGGNTTAMSEDIDMGAFNTGMSDNGRAPYRQSIPNKRIDKSRRTKHLDMVSRGEERQRGRGGGRRRRRKGSNRGSKDKKKNNKDNNKELKKNT